MLRHNVVFRLSAGAGSPEEAEFFAGAWTLADIPSVNSFELFREVNPRNDFTYGVSMEFQDLDGFRAYSVHPIHEAFVALHRPTMVDFREFDFEPLE